jgi:hypothetical protein
VDRSRFPNPLCHHLEASTANRGTAAEIREKQGPDHWSDRSQRINPRFPTFRARIVTLAILFAVFGAAVLLSGRDPCHHKQHAIVVAGILSLLAALPQSPAKAKPEPYHITQ